MMPPDDRELMDQADRLSASLDSFTSELADVGDRIDHERKLRLVTTSLFAVPLAAVVGVLIWVAAIAQTAEDASDVAAAAIVEALSVADEQQAQRCATANDLRAALLALIDYVGTIRDSPELGEIVRRGRESFALLDCDG